MSFCWLERISFVLKQCNKDLNLFYFQFSRTHFTEKVAGNDEVV